MGTIHLNMLGNKTKRNGIKRLHKAMSSGASNTNNSTTSVNGVSSIEKYYESVKDFCIDIEASLKDCQFLKGERLTKTFTDLAEKTIALEFPTVKFDYYVGDMDSYYFISIKTKIPINFECKVAKEYDNEEIIFKTIDMEDMLYSELDDIVERLPNAIRIALSQIDNSFDLTIDKVIVYVIIDGDKKRWNVFE